MRDVKIKDVPLVESLTGQEKIPVSDGSGSPKAISVQQILDKTPAPDLSEYVKTSDLVTEHEYVDLGLPSGTLWATCNVGANSPEEYGDYFAWGETTTKSSYFESNSTTYGLSTSTLHSRGIIGEDGNLTASYDAATANWGGSWRMPTRDEIKELVNNCTWKWTTYNGVNGRLVTGPNGNSIFLPAAGYRNGSYLYYAGSDGFYWSATPSSNGYNAYYLRFNSGDYDWNDDYDRYYGHAVRPVMTKYPILSNYYTKEEIDNKGYLTEHQDLSNYALKNIAMQNGGLLNLASLTVSDYQNMFIKMVSGETKLYLVTDSEGNLPSTTETAITIGSSECVFFGKSEPFGISVGDIVIFCKVNGFISICSVIPLNDVKAVNGDFPGAAGLSTPWDKERINKIDNIETIAKAALPKSGVLPSKWTANMNDALETGVYPWCTLGRPAGSTGAYTCVVDKTSTNDGSFDTIIQTAFGREGELGQVYKRIIFYKSDGTDTQYNEWVRLDNGVVSEFPENAKVGTSVIKYVSPYAKNEADVISCLETGVCYFYDEPLFPLTYEELWEYLKELTYGVDITSTSIDFLTMNYHKFNLELVGFDELSDGVPVKDLFTGFNITQIVSDYTTLIYSYELQGNTGNVSNLGSIFEGVSSVPISQGDASIELSAALLYRLIPKLHFRKESAKSYVKGINTWIEI